MLTPCFQAVAELLVYPKRNTTKMIETCKFAYSPHVTAVGGVRMVAFRLRQAAYMRQVVHMTVHA